MVFNFTPLIQKKTISSFSSQYRLVQLPQKGFNRLAFYAKSMNDDIC